jgi:RNA polymerase sigma-70 factor (ECF subfamily)
MSEARTTKRIGEIRSVTGRPGGRPRDAPICRRTYNLRSRRGAAARRPEVRCKVPEESPDRLWSQRLVAGDEGALRDVYREHAPTVLGLAERVLGNAALAEDVMQDVFVRLWEQPEQFDPARGRLRSYLLAMTHSRAVERLRAEDSQRRRVEAAGRQPVDPAQSDPTRALGVQDASSAVRRVLAGLPQEQRVPIEMAYFGGLPYREVALALGEPEGTVRYRIRAGMRKMRAALQAEEVSP